ncbi:GTP-binding protein BRASSINAZOLE INSENSITIVE PALE GREEN 2, chloroplastic [Carica papaya]|uniref:GTP-binding protein BRASSINAZOLE INSENSITIVE PALE GREEN 2, chloroplastic n=1 Tax=Carica papaya TaxID=3649 RepID=UPI000B8C8AAF|nr:GTP-binding protein BRASSINAZOLE INSENSITIVE PALE GREEN 2, chloroplastic [Carica papaya]
MAFLLSTGTRLNLKLHEHNGSRINGVPERNFSFFTGLYEKIIKNWKKEVSFICLSLKNQSLPQTKDGIKGKVTPKKGRSPVLSEGRDEDENYGLICPGCGVFMQDKDPNLPGYFKKRKLTEIKEEEWREVEEDDIEGISYWSEFNDDEAEGDTEGILEEGDEEEGELDWESDEWEAKLEIEEDDLELESFAPAGVGYGNITEETIEKRRKQRLSKAERKRIARELRKKEKDEVTVCARCHSLRNYGQVKNKAAENLIPDFDFERLVATRLIKPTGNANATVVVMVVDCVDFDGSFPKRAAKSLFKMLEGAQNDSKLAKKLPKLVLVATKVDLLPSQISPTRLDRWIRHRAKAGGAPKLSGVYLVSAHKDLGVRNLLTFIKELAGPRGNVWVIGAQNAGKSTLINAFAKKEGARVTKLTEAPIPGTTLGILRIGGILSAKAKMYDTPGLLHPYLMSMRLTRDEQKMVEIRKELQPRTYRVKVGQAVHVGGLVRLDLDHASVETIYITIWASPNVSLHLGKIDNAEEIRKSHIGVRLQPPVVADHPSELGEWEEKEIQVSGTSWDVNSIDIAVAGLGWISLGLKGEANLTLWTFHGIGITLREPLVLDRAAFLERPGFWLPGAISDIIGNQTKDEAQKKKKRQGNVDFLSEVSA